MRVTLVTDFGTRDGYAGAIAGVIARLAPDAIVTDIAHDVPPHDIAHAAWVVRTACREFPAGTVHLVVVDPGVGGSRRGVVATYGGHWYVGPDNGVFAYLDRASAWDIDTAFPRGDARVSPTFHGRDIFAPAAARLARGDRPAGPHDKLHIGLPWGAREPRHGRVVHVDRFGNVISDLPATEVESRVAISGRTLPLRTTYADVAPGELVAYIGSASTVEVGVRDGRADTALAVTRGDAVMPA
jgi:S-adenosylmethionine hydrolase